MTEQATQLPAVSLLGGSNAVALEREQLTEL